MAEATYPIGLQQRLNRIADKYASILMERVRKELAKFSRTNELLDSLRLKIIPASGEQTPEIILEYAAHGEFIGKRRLLFTRQPPLEDFERWVDVAGFTPSRIPGYKGDAPNLSIQQKQARFAFAIARDKKQNDTHKPKRWKKKALPEVLRSINAEIIEAYAREVEHEIVHALTNT